MGMATRSPRTRRWVRVESRLFVALAFIPWIVAALIAVIIVAGAILQPNGAAEWGVTPFLVVALLAALVVEFWAMWWARADARERALVDPALKNWPGRLLWQPGLVPIYWLTVVRRDRGVR